MITNRDRNLLCRIEEMRKAQVAEKEERRLTWRRAKATEGNCLASKRRVAHLREVFKGKEEV